MFMDGLVHPLAWPVFCITAAQGDVSSQLEVVEHSVEVHTQVCVCPFLDGQKVFYGRLIVVTQCVQDTGDKPQFSWSEH